MAEIDPSENIVRLGQTDHRLRRLKGHRVDQILLGGSNCEKLAKSSRWLSARYAMIRHGKAHGTIAPTKVSGADNLADIVTKALTGAQFEKLRGVLLGHAYRKR